MTTPRDPDPHRDDREDEATVLLYEQNAKRFDATTPTTRSVAAAASRIPSPSLPLDLLSPLGSFSLPPSLSLSSSLALSFPSERVFHRLCARRVP